MFNNVRGNVPEFYHMNSDDFLKHLLMHAGKYVSNLLCETWIIIDKTI